MKYWNNVKVKKQKLNTVETYPLLLYYDRNTCHEVKFVKLRHNRELCQAEIKESKRRKIHNYYENLFLKNLKRK